MAAPAMTRASAARRGVLLEAASVAWMVVEAILAIGAGIAARSVLLTAFGFDSVIEFLSASLLLWRLSSEAREVNTARLELVEVRATKVSAALLVALCLYVASLLGLSVAIAAVVVMPTLALGKRATNRVLESAALKADIAETTVCAYMAATVVLGIGVNRLAGWWWAEYVAAVLLLFWLVRETREAVEAARAGRSKAGSDDD
jgi:divalent metal cation (Fe/Co/Zn/Cd) transporter